MMAETKVRVYYGPLAWLHKQLGTQEREYLLDIVSELDDAKRRITHSVEGQEVEELEPDDEVRPGLVVAESADYASMQTHAIMNFVGLIRLLDPEHLVLHNPPAHVQTQLAREFETEVHRYVYPSVERDTLIKFRDGFSSHLVGQEGVKDALLAALYPLMTDRREKPVVMMFYGPSGVGKTETAEFVNKLLGGALLRKQFSMFHNDRFASYLFGGAHSEDSFARDLLDRESGVVLIDEFDKANSVFHSAFYQLFDGGVFEDKNYSVELGRSVIICTSNYGTEDEIRHALGDALFSRFDALIQFKQLSEDELLRVIDRLVDARFDVLTEDEKQVVDAGDVKVLLRPAASKIGNVRKLRKLVEQVISLILVRRMLDDDGSSKA